MKLHTIAANDMRQLLAKANEMGIQQENIVNVFQTKEGLFELVYFAED